jgi:hypothetical protein
MRTWLGNRIRMMTVSRHPLEQLSMISQISSSYIKKGLMWSSSGYFSLRVYEDLVQVFSPLWRVFTSNCRIRNSLMSEVDEYDCSSRFRQLLCWKSCSEANSRAIQHISLEIVTAAKVLSTEQCRLKSADIIMRSLAVHRFVDNSLYRSWTTMGRANDRFIQSIESCRIDH